MNPRLLVMELWGLGDLVIATPFLQAAAARYEVTLLARPYAQELQPHLWPGVEMVPFTAPWTAFEGKYKLWHWPWRELFRLRRELRSRRFACGVSARWDPRDHFALKWFGAVERLGFPRLQSNRYLTRPLVRPAPLAHRYEFWRVAGEALGLELPPREKVFLEDHPRRVLLETDMTPSPRPSGERVGVRGVKTEKKKASSPLAMFAAAAPSSEEEWEKTRTVSKCTCMRPPVVLIHTGARLPLRVWPLENYREIIHHLRAQQITVQIVCDPDQVAAWRDFGEMPAWPRSVTELMGLLTGAGVFIGNDSGPGHLAAACGVPTFTLFGPQLHEWFAPLHPASEILEGKACPYKPCSDYCRFSEPFCLRGITVAEAWPRIEAFVRKNFKPHVGD